MAVASPNWMTLNSVPQAWPGAATRPWGSTPDRTPVAHLVALARLILWQTSWQGAGIVPQDDGANLSDKVEKTP